MIPGPIEQIDATALHALITNEVREDKTTEYKIEMPGSASSDLVPLVATVSSFANTAGGDLVIGVEATDGVPTGIPGVEIDNVDKETLRIEQVLRSNIEPRIPHLDIHTTPVSDDRVVLVIRVSASWIAPHRVNRNSKFYARNSAGRYDLDVGELRTAFTMSETIATRIRDFRADRIARIYGNQAPVPLKQGGCMIVHILPLGAFSTSHTVGLASYQGSNHRLGLLGSSGSNSRINLDGVVEFIGDEGGYSWTYTQVFRTGVVEAVNVLLTHEGRMNLPSEAYEKDVMKFLSGYYSFATEFEIDPPYYFFLSLVGVRGCKFGVGTRRWGSDEAVLIREETVMLPDVVIESRTDPPHQVLRPAFDMVWNAFGFAESSNYNDQGEWVGQ